MSEEAALEIAALRAENAMLRGTLRALERELGLATDLAARDCVRHALTVSPAESHILAVLADAYPRPVQMWALVDQLPGFGKAREDGLLKVHICRLRRKFGKDAITTHTRAYAASEALCARVKVAQALAQPNRNAGVSLTLEAA